MWNIPSPSANTAIVDLVAAFTRADGRFDYELTNAEKTQISDVYAKYDELKGRPAPELLAPNLSQALKTAIQAAYGHVQQGKRLHYLRERLRLVASRCPLCGIGPVTDLDHHLPQSVYEALSVYCRNLVPTCHTCNNKKRAIVGETPNQQFIHSYLEVLPIERFLEAQSIVQNGALIVDFQIQQTPSMSPDVYDRLSFQILRLDLSRRYRQEINVFLASLEVSLFDAFGSDKNAGRLSEFLSRSATSHERNFGLNDWRVALLNSIAANQEFCEGGFRQACALPA